jgi:hypothetical protein
MAYEWQDDLSDSEIEERLVHRGISPLVAEVLVAHRDEEEAKEVIERTLG